MPHSSGGSSSSGGFSGGSSSSHSSGGSSSYSGAHSSTISRTKPEGASTHYIYYHNGSYQNYYTQGCTKETLSTDFYYAVLCFIIATIATIVAICFAFTFIRPINVPRTQQSAYIQDNINCITEKEEAELNVLFQNFYEETGISMTLLTTDNSYKEDFNNLELYAYDTYVKMYGDDETHWLIVYSQDNARYWEFEGMQGNDTDSIISYKVANKFTSELDKNLRRYSNNNDINFSDVFSKTLESSIPKINTITLNDIDHLMGTIFLAFVAIIFFISGAVMCFDSRDRRIIKNKAIEVPKKIKILEDKCDYCDGIYIIGTVTVCPHCGGALHPHDENGNRLASCTMSDT